MIDTRLPAGFTKSAPDEPGSSKHFLILRRDGIRIGVFAKELPMLDEVLAKVARGHAKRYPDEVWARMAKNVAEDRKGES